MNEHNPQQKASQDHGTKSVVLASQPSLFPQVSGVHGSQGDPAPPLQNLGHETHAGIQSFPTAPLADICRRKHKGNKYSEAANERVHPTKNSVREEIYRLIAASAGLTSKEIAKKLNKQLHQISGRISELKADGRIEEASAVREDAAVLRAKGTCAK